jgi:hypothetical protein
MIVLCLRHYMHKCMIIWRKLQEVQQKYFPCPTFRLVPGRRHATLGIYSLVSFIAVIRVFNFAFLRALTSWFHVS